VGDEPTKEQRPKTLTPKGRDRSQASRRRSPPAAGQETEVARLTRELNEALERQAATSEVLKVISNSRGNLRAVFETVAESSVRLCGADRAFIFRFDGELLRMAVAYNASPEFAEWVDKHPIRPGRHSGSARAALERRTIHVPDVLARNPLRLCRSRKPGRNFHIRWV